MAPLDTIFKAYDVRGTVPDQLDADIARRVGAAFARFAGAGSIMVARDMRPSGVELSAAFADGATGQGVDVVDLGMASTDLIYYAAGRFDAPGAMFTASHNPAGYNGIKLCLAGAKPVGQDTGLAVPNLEAGIVIHNRGRAGGVAVYPDALDQPLLIGGDNEVVGDTDAAGGIGGAGGIEQIRKAQRVVGLGGIARIVLEFRPGGACRSGSAVFGSRAR